MLQKGTNAGRIPLRFKNLVKNLVNLQKDANNDGLNIGTSSCVDACLNLVGHSCINGFLFTSEGRVVIKNARHRL